MGVLNLVLEHSQPDKLLCTITHQSYKQVLMIVKIIFYIFTLKKLYVFVARRYCLLLFLLVLTSSTSGNPLSRSAGSESKKVSSSFAFDYTSCSLPSLFLLFRNLLDLDMVLP